MKIFIVHDSERGNGKLMAERLETELKALGATVVVGHRSEITPEQVASGAPKLLIIGSAVRKFMMSPPAKRWIASLASKLKASGSLIPYVATFITHLMPDQIVEGRVERLKRHILSSGSIVEVYSEWLSGQVKAIPGPFVDGVIERTSKYAADVHAWVQSH